MTAIAAAPTFDMVAPNRQRPSCDGTCRQESAIEAGFNIVDVVFILGPRSPQKGSHYAH